MSLSSVLLLKDSDSIPTMSEFNMFFGSNQTLKRELVKFISSGDIRYTSENGILEYLNFNSMDIRTSRVVIKELQKIPSFFDKYFILHSYKKEPKTSYFIEVLDTGKENIISI